MKLETYILIKRCPIQLNLNLLNILVCDFIRSIRGEHKTPRKKHLFLSCVVF